MSMQVSLVSPDCDLSQQCIDTMCSVHELTWYESSAIMAVNAAQVMPMPQQFSEKSAMMVIRGAHVSSVDIVGHRRTHACISDGCIDM